MSHTENIGASFLVAKGLNANVRCRDEVVVDNLRLTTRLTFQRTSSPPFNRVRGTGISRRFAPKILDASG